MDFLDPKKRRWHTVRLFTGYVLVTIAIGLAATILIYLAYGFGVTRQGDLVQKGLVFVSSQPSGAQLFVDDKRANDTNTKLNLAAGSYGLKISREGYSDWQRRIQVDGGSVSHFVYPFLFPSDLQTTDIKKYEDNPRLTTQSPDRRWIVVQLAAQESQFEVFDLSKNQDSVGTATDFNVQTSLLTQTATPATWEVVEWSTNNRHILFKRSYTQDNVQKAEYILVDRQRPEGSYNLSRELNIDAMVSDLSLLDKKPDNYYIHNRTEKTISTASLSDTQPKQVLKDALAFKAHGKDVIVYVTDKDAPEGIVYAKVYSKEREYTLRTLQRSDTYLLDAARFDGKWYVVAGSKTSGRAFIYEDPIDQINQREDKKAGALFSLRVPNPIDVSFSANAQFIALQGSTRFHVYDIDREQAFRYTSRFPLDAPQPYASWMDGNRFTYVSGGKQVVFEYDNANRRTLVPASITYASSFDRNYEYLYTFVQPSDGQPGITLTAAPLRTPDDL